MSQQGEFNSQEQIEAKEAEELRLKNQKEYDPKVHGAGTAPVAAPETVTELYKLMDKVLTGFDSRISYLGSQVSYLSSRVTDLESKEKVQ